MYNRILGSLLGKPTTKPSPKNIDIPFPRKPIKIMTNRKKKYSKKKKKLAGAMYYSIDSLGGTSDRLVWKSEYRPD